MSHPNASLTMLRMPAPFSSTFTRSAAILALCLSFVAFGQPTDGDFAAARDAYRAGVTFARKLARAVVTEPVATASTPVAGR